MARKLTASFFERPTLKVARELLGKYLVVKQRGRIFSGKIVETEAYIGENDLACHASRGRTPRTEPLYQKAGTLYVYLVYGMYHCVNVVTERADFPSAVLIRAVEPCEGILEMQKRRGVHSAQNLASGPGKLCDAFGITKKLNGKTISGRELWIEDREEMARSAAIATTPRIGVHYAKKCKEYPWRFYLKNSSFISHTRRKK